MASHLAGRWIYVCFCLACCHRQFLNTPLPNKLLILYIICSLFCDHWDDSLVGLLRKNSHAVKWIWVQIPVIPRFWQIWTLCLFQQLSGYLRSSTLPSHLTKKSMLLWVKEPCSSIFQGISQFFDYLFKTGCFRPRHTQELQLVCNELSRTTVLE